MMADNYTSTVIKGDDQPLTFTSEVTIHELQDIKLNAPVMIEGLPGFGHVGKLVAEHLIDVFHATRIIDIYSIHFPPQAIVLDDCAVRLARNEIYACKSKDGKSDMLILVGDNQSATTRGHYILCDVFLDIAKRFNVSRIYTLGGYATGQLEDTGTVIGAVNNPDMVKELSEYGVDFQESEPWGGIIGVSGILLAMSIELNIDAVCLMGITSGYIVDPMSAQAVLRVLSQALGIEVDMQALEEHAAEMEKVVAKLEEMQQMQMSLTKGDEDLRYIG